MVSVVILTIISVLISIAALIYFGRGAYKAYLEDDLKRLIFNLFCLLIMLR